jgi:hypothetical protein
VAKGAAKGLVYIGIWYWYLSVSKKYLSSLSENSVRYRGIKQVRLIFNSLYINNLEYLLFF